MIIQFQSILSASAVGIKINQSTLTIIIHLKYIDVCLSTSQRKTTLTVLKQ